jgi:hypothetical protein
MKKGIFAILVTVFCAMHLMAQGTFVYTNNDRAPNSISVLSVGANGALSSVPGSPFVTGGNGVGSGAIASNRIAVVGNLLYAANGASNNVSAFSINPATGVLTSLPGSPFATGGNAGQGIALTATPDNKFLIAGGSRTITVFSIAANGALSQIARSPFNSGASASDVLISAKVTSDGKSLAVSSGADILMFNIYAAGMLVATSSAKTTTYESITVTIPFGFSVQGRVLPAGTYVMRQLRDEPDAPGGDPNDCLYQIQSEDRRGPMTSMQTTSLGADSHMTDRTKLVFNKYGDQYFLSQIWASGEPQGHAVLKSHKERELIKKGGLLARGERAEEVTVQALH